MVSDEQEILKKLSPFLRIIKDRESLYFSTLGFINKNIQSSSNDLDQIYIFNKFITLNQQKQAQLNQTQTTFISTFLTETDSKRESRKISSKSIDIIRHEGRLLQELQMSVESVANTIFGENGKIKNDFEKLKKQLNKIRQKGSIRLIDFVTAFITFSKAKYDKHILKLKRYLNKLEVGQSISLRDFYNQNPKSDISLSLSEKQSKPKENPKKIRKKQTQMQSPHKKTSVKKQSNRPRRGTTVKMRRDESVGSEKGREQKGKEGNANKLLKFYAILELNKKQFLEDYVFDKQVEEQQNKKIFNNLLEKNKNNGEQIQTYIKKCHSYNPSIHKLYHPSSDENQILRDQSRQSRVSLKPNFIIKPRKPSWNLQSPNTDKSDTEAKISQSRTYKNFSQKSRPSPQSTARKKNTSKKLVFAKQPMIFQGELIPKVQINQNKWLQESLTGRNRSRRNEQLRIKNRNNPVPIENSRFPESFTFTQYPI